MFSHKNHQNNQEKTDLAKQIVGLTFKCQKCSVTFDQYKDLKIHMKNHMNSNHENEKKEETLKKDEKKENEPKTRYVFYICKYVPKNLTNYLI